jgi:hypothetical protein
MSASTTNVLFPTAIAGSLPKPAWLAAPNQLWAPWRLEGGELDQAKDDATLLALKLQEDAGIDIVGDGEQAARGTLAAAGRRRSDTSPCSGCCGCPSRRGG